MSPIFAWVRPSEKGMFIYYILTWIVKYLKFPWFETNFKVRIYTKIINVKVCLFVRLSRQNGATDWYDFYMKIVEELESDMVYFYLSLLSRI